MKKTIKLALVAAMAIGATSAFATNGDNLIGLGAKSRGMAGAGIGMSHGAESGLSNPALIKGDEVTFGGTIFMPDVKFNNAMTFPTPAGMATVGTEQASSDSDLSVIPEVAVSVEVNKHFAWGVGMYGVAGMGVDYRDDAAQYQGNNYAGTKSGTNQMLTNLQLMRFALPLVYKNKGFSLAVSPILQYGSLSISYNNGAAITAPQIQPNGTVAYGSMPVNTGNGVSQDFGFGYNVGLAYEWNNLTIGAVYTSAIDMEYKNQISVATKQFGLNRGAGLSDNLEQPAEYGVGLSYKIKNAHTLAFDYKNIAWSSAKGYEDFKWEDQDVFIVGYQYQAKKWAFRLGYNYASNPIKEQTAGNMMTDYDGAVINYFNAAGFPATVESHYAIGGSYQVSDKIGLDFAYTYAPEVTESYDTSALSQYQVYAGAYGQYKAAGAPDAQAAGGAQQAAGATSSEATVKHSQQAVSVAMTIKF